MFCQCDICQEFMAMVSGKTNQYCPGCGQQTYEVPPLPLNPNSFPQEKTCGICASRGGGGGGGAESLGEQSRIIWNVASTGNHRGTSVMSGNSFFGNASNMAIEPSFQKGSVATSTFGLQQDANIRSYAISSGQQGNRGRCSTNRRTQQAYSVPNVAGGYDVANDARIREADTARHLAALEREADALQATRQKIRSTMDNDEARKKQTLNVMTKERKKDIELAITKQNEMELIQAVDRRKHAEEEAAILLKQQEIDALECTRRRLQLEASKRRREHELSDLEWRRRAAELAAEEAARRRQELEDCVNMFRGPCYSPVAPSTHEIDHIQFINDHSEKVDASVVTQNTGVGTSSNFAAYKSGGAEVCCHCQLGGYTPAPMKSFTKILSKPQSVARIMPSAILDLSKTAIPTQAAPVSKSSVISVPSTALIPSTDSERMLGRSRSIVISRPSVASVSSTGSRKKLGATRSSMKPRSRSILRNRASAASMSSTGSDRVRKQPDRSASKIRQGALTPAQRNQIKKIESNLDQQKSARRQSSAVVWRSENRGKKKSGCTIQ